MSLVTIYSSFSPMDAHLVRSRLEAAGVAAVVTHELAALSMEGYSMAAGGIRVEVASEDVEEAREILSVEGTTDS